MSGAVPLRSASPAADARDLSHAFAAARAHLDALRACYTALARDPDPGGPVEERLKALLAGREALVRALGEALLGWVADGETLAWAEREATGPDGEEAVLAGAAPALAVAEPVLGVEEPILAVAAPAHAGDAPALAVAEAVALGVAADAVEPTPVGTASVDPLAVEPAPADPASEPPAPVTTAAAGAAPVTTAAAGPVPAPAVATGPADTIAAPADSAATVSPPPIASPAASATDLSRLCAAAFGPDWARTPAASPRQQGVVRTPVAPDLDALARALRSAYDTPAADLGAAVARCVALAEALALAGSAPAPLLHALMRAWVGLARDVQDRVPSSAPLQAAFRRVLDLSTEARPGKVNGLGRNHRPVRTWLDDGRDAAEEAVFRAAARDATTPERALALLERLVDGPDEVVRLATAHAREIDVADDDPRLIRILAPRASALSVGKEFSALRRALRDAAREADTVPTPEEPDADLPADWPHLARTSGARIALVGGDLREERRARLAAAFGVGELAWVSGKQPRQVQSLADRVRAGTIDMVWVLAGFCSHKASNALAAACEPRQVLLVTVSKGTGVQNVRLALERHLGGRER